MRQEARPAEGVQVRIEGELGYGPVLLQPVRARRPRGCAVTDEANEAYVDRFQGMTDDEVAAKARLYWLAELEEEADADRPPAYDTTYDWNP